jgi:hypothetical protein
VPAGRGVSTCDPVDVYYSPGAGNQISMVVGSDGPSVDNCQQLEADHGFVSAVAGNDSTLSAPLRK